MPSADPTRETLPEEIRHDPATRLPLLSEQAEILDLIMVYLALPYSVAEHGCGKKCSLIIDQLLGVGIPPWAIRRGMIVERDMSPSALDQRDASHRPHALVAANPLPEIGDLDDPTLLELLNESLSDVEVGERQLRAGPYRLQRESSVQFVLARSHVFPILSLWDKHAGAVVERVIDPTLDARALFEVETIRELLDAPEGLLFEAPLTAHFRLEPAWLTSAQREAVTAELGPERELAELSVDEHAALVRALTGAEAGSIGDPQCWTYANNVGSEALREPDTGSDRRRRELSGRGDELRALRSRLIDSRVAARVRDVERIRGELQTFVEQAELAAVAREDALAAERRLEPLARVALTMVYHRSLRHLAATLERGAELGDYLARDPAYAPVRGLGVRQRRRIDRLALVSEDPEGRIDARALNRQYLACAIETVRQMNQAELTVFVDAVGNLHGLELDGETRAKLRAGELELRELTATCVMFGSHIDTVSDAGKFDGRLGVSAGIEIAHVIRDLRRYCGRPLVARRGPIGLMVTAFVGEEMSFTGEGVSMPGSAAIAGQAAPARIYAMTNIAGERFGERLEALLAGLAEAAAEGHIELFNELAGREGQALLDACSDPQAFYSRHSFERHIEQGPILDRHAVPLALVDTIMGIHQEDLTITGARAEAAALELDCRLRELLERPDLADSRITVGVIEALGEPMLHAEPEVAFRCVLDGETNHAGSIPTANRADAGVAAGRLVRAFHRLLGDYGIDSDAPVLVGDVELVPGLGRNVIPGQASLTLALDVTHEAVAELDLRNLQRRLGGFASGELGASVSRGGEGLGGARIEPASFVNVAGQVRLTIDVRGPKRDHLDAIDAAIAELSADIGEQFAVEISREIQQRLAPQELEQTGQVLVIERSYGGSHNPREAEMTRDLTRACVLQLAVLRELFERESIAELDLVGLVERHIPARWLERLPRFVSGALHDTCNISARASELDAGRP